MGIRQLTAKPTNKLTIALQIQFFTAAILKGLDNQFPKAIELASVNGQQFDGRCLFPIVDYDMRSHHYAN